MIAAYNPLYSVKTLLENIVNSRDNARLAECLEGKHLPALGGDDHPADILYRALTLQPFNPNAAKKLAGLISTLCTRRAQLLQQAVETRLKMVAGDTISVTIGADRHFLDDEIYVFNMFLFASYLPADKELFESLRFFQEVGLRTGVLMSGYGRAGRQLRQSLTYQQVDASLESHWFGILEEQTSAVGGWMTPEHRTDILDAWQALLWIPPSKTDRDAGRIVSIERLTKGIVALHKAVENTLDEVRMLRYVLRQLAEAYPRSPEFWKASFSAHLKELPERLRDVLSEQWPILAEDFAPEENIVSIPEDAQMTWEALGELEKAEIEKTASTEDESLWKKLWGTLLFIPPRAGLTPQHWRLQLQKIKDTFGKHYPRLTQKVEIKATLSLSESLDDESGADVDIKKKAKGKGKSIDRLRAYDGVTRALEAINRKLQERDEATARQYLDELVDRQKGDGTEASKIAKTLCSAATNARDFGYFQLAELWYEQARKLADNDPVVHKGLAETLKAQDRLEEAENLYRQTVARWPNDVITYNGLAEILKAQNRLEEAENLYRQTVARWPNNVYAHTGLAETLKAQDRLEEAENLYRQTVARWPNNVIAYNGLAEILKAQDCLEEAENLYRQTVARWPNDVITYNGLAETLKAQDRLEEAENLYRQTVARWPNNVYAHTGLAETLKAQDRLEEAENLYRQTVARWPNNAVVKHGLSNLLRKLKHFGEALALVPERESLVILQHKYDAHLRGMILLDSGNMEDALDIFRQALSNRLSPHQLRLFRTAIAIAEFRRKKFSEALDILNSFEDTTQVVRTLKIHANAELGDAIRTREMYAQLCSENQPARKVVRNTLQLIEKGYCINSGNGLCSPTPEELDEIIHSEVDMLLAA